MKNYIKILLREGLLGEEYVNGSLVGYHVTSLRNIDSIKSDGLKVGSRAMQGKGLYGFYDYGHASRYARKGEIKEPIIIKFYITNPSRFLYLNMDIAKEVLNDDYHLINQIEKYFYGGFDEFYNYVLSANPNITRDKLVDKLEFIEKNNTESNQRTFFFELIPSELNNRLNIVWDGYYGLEFRINNTNYVKVIGYEVIDLYGKESKFNEFTILDKIPNDSKYDILRDFLNNNQHINTIQAAYNIVNDKYMKSRNNKDFEYYGTLEDLLDELK